MHTVIRQSSKSTLPIATIYLAIDNAPTARSRRIEDALRKAYSLWKRAGWPVHCVKLRDKLKAAVDEYNRQEAASGR